MESLETHEIPNPAKHAPLSAAFQRDLQERVPEILAPVGGREQFFAALNSGADAVFLGLKTFNARSRAENFTIEELETLVPIAHRYGMKVLVTLNILIKDHELKDVIPILGALEKLSVDAVILQDMGIARLAKRHFPSLRLHASTQLAVHNLAGVIEAKRSGFSRVVLARELTAEEIRRIRRAVDVELEVFCHGSLCYSYSGLCFFSGAADGRSGNRGECAYTCREPYKVVSEPGHGFLFSMRDLDTSKKLDKMIEGGVHALKIEGRKKDAQYVASVVRLYREKLNQLFAADTLRENAPPLARGTTLSEAEIRRDLQLSFQRNTTSFFFENRYHENVIDLDNPSHNGIKVGVIEAIQPDVITVRLEDDVEKYDGLKLVRANKLYHARPQDGDFTAGQSDLRRLSKRYENEETSFSLRDMWFKGRKIYEASRGMKVDIHLSSGANDVAVGDFVFKTRSNHLKSRIEKISGVPVGERLRPMVPVTTLFNARPLDDGAIGVSASIIRSGAVIAEVFARLERCDERRQGHLEADVKDIFSIYGDEGVYTKEFRFMLEENYFLPRSVLKDLKRRLSENLSKRIASIFDQHIHEALADIDQTEVCLKQSCDVNFNIKIDRLEYLPWIENLANEFPIKELIFEPKKMFLPGVRPELFLDALLGFNQKTNIKVRLAIPTIVRAWDEPVLELWLKTARLKGFESFEVGNIGAFELMRSYSLPLRNVTSDFSLYTLNREAARGWYELGVSRAALSIEDDWESLKILLANWPSGVNPEVILYKDTPLFIAEACSLTALHNGCPSSKVCGYRTLEIENSKGERFHVAHEGCKSVVFAERAFSLSGKRSLLEKAGVSHFRIDFLTRPYTQEALETVIRSVAADKPLDGTHCANFEGTLK